MSRTASAAFLICPEPVRHVTAGVGTRFVTLAGILAEAGHRVTLAVPNDPEEAGDSADGVELIRADPGRLGAQAEDHGWVLVHGHLANHYLKTSTMSGSEISFLLGFEDPNSFFRAFHTWTGRTPELVRTSARAES